MGMASGRLAIKGHMEGSFMGADIKREAVIWGAGKIGRGFLAEIFQDANYNIAFVEYDRQLVNSLKDVENYTIHKAVSADNQSTISIEGFDIFTTDDTESIKGKLIKEDAIAAIAVHQKALDSIAKTISQIIIEKAKGDPTSKLDIIMCVNMHRPSIYFKGLLQDELPCEFHNYLTTNVGLIDSVVMRICPEPTPELLAVDPFAVLTNGYDQMPVDGKSFRGNIPNTAMLKLSQDIVAEEVRKIYTLNMSHAILAYVGNHKGYKYAYEAIGDAYIRQVVAGALCEVGRALSFEYGFSKEEMERWNLDIIESLKNPALDDTLVRLGSDTKRKLSAGDRLAGPAALCMKHDVFPENIGVGIAFAFTFEGAEDNGAIEVRQYVESMGIEAAIGEYSGIRDETLVSHIQQIYDGF